MADATANEPTIQGQLPLYKKPEPLSAQAHKGKGITYTGRPFDFLADTHFVPLTVGEFGLAASRFPILFLGENRTPVAAMGLQQGANLFVNPQNGLYEENCYLPAFVRRYPFVAASHGDDSDRFTVCVDAGSHLFSDTPEEPFFNEDGTPTPFLERAIDYVRRFESDVAQTVEFVKELRDLDLFDQQQTNLRQPCGGAAGRRQLLGRVRREGQSAVPRQSGQAARFDGAGRDLRPHDLDVPVGAAASARRPAPGSDPGQLPAPARHAAALARAVGADARHM
ncbi:SapC family protein [Hyphomonadaceae bacterium ML37]|nr:SapC family protein [Hyphomonadaceae bacterium ML37]